MLFSRISKSVSLFSVLGGISKSLKLVNDFIPIYNQVKPTINKSKELLNYFKNFSNITKTPVTTEVTKQNYNKKTNNNLPVFFS